VSTLSASVRRAIDGLVAVAFVVVFVAASGLSTPGALGAGPSGAGPRGTGSLGAAPRGAGPLDVDPIGASPDPTGPFPALEAGSTTGAGGPDPGDPSAGPPAGTAPPFPGWGTPVLVENFSGPNLDLSRWGVYDSPDQTPPRSPDAVRVSNGELQLIGGFDATLGKDLSGGVESTLNQLYGRWEARIRVDRGAGYSGVVLLWPQTENWPTDGEVDIAEVNTGTRQSAVNFLHNGVEDDKIGHVMTADFTAWHTVAVEWLPGQVTFYLDGAVVFSQTGPTYVPGTSPMHLTLQLDQGCDDFIECRNASTPDQVTMHIDWVKAYRLPF